MWGFHITPVHFYQPVPNVRELPDSLWDRECNPIGMDLRLEEQVILLREFTRHRDAYETLPRTDTGDGRFYLQNSKFESVDAEILFCFIRTLRPRRIIEIGAGFSTLLMVEVIQSMMAEDPEYDCSITSIEPYPAAGFKEKLPSFVTVIEQPVETLALDTFLSLRANDILFIDSSHVLKIGGDVQFEILHVIPSVAKGVAVHVHDVFIPGEYPSHWVKEEHRFFTEQYLLQAFLSFNDSFEVVWSGAAMQRKHPNELAKAFSSYTSDAIVPGSFWIRRVK